MREPEMGSKLYTYVFFIFIVAIQGKTALAGCDTCIQSAVSGANAKISGSLTRLNQTVSTTSNSMKLMDSTVKASNTALTGLMATNNQALLTSLDGATKPLGLELSKLLDGVKELTDSQNTEFARIITGIDLARQIEDDARTQSVERAQPMSLFISSARASKLKDALVEKRNIQSEQSAAFNSWSTEMGKEYTNKTRLDLTVKDKLRENGNLLSKLSGTLIDEESAELLQEVIRYVINPSPSPSFTNSGAGNIKQEAARVRQLNLMQIKHLIYSTAIADKSPILDPEQWDLMYVEISKAENGKTSLEEYYEAETTRKLFSEAWLTDIASKSEASALREQAIQTTMETALLRKLIEKEEQSILLLTTLVK
jgi:hypothetical protein